MDYDNEDMTTTIVVLGLLAAGALYLLVSKFPAVREALPTLAKQAWRQWGPPGLQLG